MISIPSNTHKTLFPVLFCLMTYLPSAWSISIEERAYRSFIAGDFAQFKPIIAEIQKDKTLTVSQTIQLLDYQYTYIAFLFREKRKSEAEPIVKQFESTLKILEKASPKTPELWAFKTYGIAYTLRLYPYKAPFIASDAKKYTQKAISLDANSPWGYFASGNNLLYAPEAFGGNKKEAVKAFAKAVSLFEAKSIAQYDFEYLHCLRMLVEAHKMVGEYDLAMQVCHKILSIEPNYKLVRDVILVELTKQKKKK